MTFNVKIRVKDLYGFTIYHAYAGVLGKIWILFSLFCLGMAVYTYGDVTIQNTVVFVFLGMLFTVLNPAILYYKCFKRIKKVESYKEEFCYEFNKKGFSVSQGDQKIKFDWQDVFQIVCKKKAVYICLDPIHAQIIPLDQLGDNAEELKTFLKNKIPENIRKKGL